MSRRPVWLLLAPLIVASAGCSATPTVTASLPPAPTTPTTPTPTAPTSTASGDASTTSSEAQGSPTTSTSTATTSSPEGGIFGRPAAPKPTAKVPATTTVTLTGTYPGVGKPEATCFLGGQDWDVVVKWPNGVAFGYSYWSAGKLGLARVIVDDLVFGQEYSEKDPPPPQITYAGKTVTFAALDLSTSSKAATVNGSVTCS